MIHCGHGDLADWVSTRALHVWGISDTFLGGACSNHAGSHTRTPADHRTSASVTLPQGEVLDVHREVTRVMGVDFAREISSAVGQRPHRSSRWRRLDRQDRVLATRVRHLRPNMIRRQFRHVQAASEGKSVQALARLPSRCCFGALAKVDKPRVGCGFAGRNH